MGGPDEPEKLCTIWTNKSVRSQEMKLDGLKKCEWTIQRAKTARSKGIKMDALEGLNF